MNALALPYFEKKWAECQALAKTKKYAIYDIVSKFERYATAQDIWGRHEIGANGTYLLRNAFCISSPIWGFCSAISIAAKVTPRVDKDQRYLKRRLYPYDIVIERLEDQRACPKNIDITQDVDPLTQEDLSLDKLQSPQMIYLSNYVTDAKAFMRAVLEGENKHFHDPYSREKFSPEERKRVTDQILKIFQISQEDLDSCFQVGEKVEWFLDYQEPDRFKEDFRGVNEQGQFTKDAKHSLMYSFNNLEDPTLPQIDKVIDEELQQAVIKKKQQILDVGIHVDSGNAVLANYLLQTSIQFQVAVGSIDYPFIVDLSPFLTFELLKGGKKDEEVKKFEVKIAQIKEGIRRFMRLTILDSTDFKKDLRKKDQVKSCIECFEQITGVSLREDF